jgi:tetratricopeptide (TPR) repeat protein
VLLIRSLLVAILFTGCATHSPQTDKLLEFESEIPQKAFISDVPFHVQAQNHCGPAALTMVLQHAGKDASIEEVTGMTFTPGMQGTLQTDLITASRRLGMLTLPVKDLRSLLFEISEQHPVLVFQNVGLKKIPKWHYAVAVGYDLSGPDIMLHTGEDKFKEVDLRFFERTWDLAQNWAIMVLSPGDLSETATELEHLSATAALESIGLLNEAEKSYLAILRKWQTSFGAMIGMGNIHYARGQFKKSVGYLKEATIIAPKSAMAWHNLAIAQWKSSLRTAAKNSAKTAIELATEEEAQKFHQSLKDILKR